MPVPLHSTDPSPSRIPPSPSLSPLLSTRNPIHNLLGISIEETTRRIQHPSQANAIACIALLWISASLFGATVGAWRSWEQALCTGVKIPLILSLTALGNGLINGLLAPLLGIPITLRQSLFAVALSFTYAALVLAALAPVVAFFICSLPSASADLSAARFSFKIIQLTAVLIIAFSGVVANLRLFDTLHALAGNPISARRVLSAWLAANLFLGAQLSWIARPFFGQPDLPVQFLRPDAFNGNFFEAFAYNVRHLFDP